MYYLITTAAAVFSFRTQAALSAALAANPGAVTSKDDDLKQVPTPMLVTLHNLIRPEKPIKKFQDRETAERRMKGVLEVLAKPGAELAETLLESSPSTESTDMGTAKKSTSARKRTAPKSADAPRRGRTHKYAGKTIHKLVDKNPRKEGTVGHASWAVLREGMTYEKYIEAGGRKQDLEWDLAHKWVEVK